MSSIKPVVFVPMERAWCNADLLFPSFINIAQSGVPFFNIPYNRTDKARELAALELLKSEYTHIVMLDSDQKHPADIVDRLCSHAIKDPGKRIIGGLYFRRGEPYNPLAWQVGDDDLLHVIENWPAGLIEVDVIGTGALMIERGVFEEMTRPWFYYDYEDINNPGFAYPTEDITFCINARNAGIRIYCDTTIISPHMTANWIDQRTYRSYRKMLDAQKV